MSGRVGGVVGVVVEEEDGMVGGRMGMLEVAWDIRRLRRGVGRGDFSTYLDMLSVYGVKATCRVKRKLSCVWVIIHCRSSPDTRHVR